MGVDHRDKVRYMERIDQLFVMRMMLVAERERQVIKRQCCEEVEQR